MVLLTMTRKLLRLLITFSLLIAPSVFVFGLGIGQIRVNSALNQPLDAEITLNSLGDIDLARLSVGIASSEAYAQAGVERLPMLSDLKFAVQAQPEGREIIKITSTRPIREPVLNFLIELNWPQGKLLREFVVLLEPSASIALSAKPIALSGRRLSQPETPLPAVSERGTETYGPVPYGDTLWNIAKKVRPHPSINLQEMMQALLRANPQAFSRPDIDYLLAGTTLRIPSPEEISPRYAGLAQSTVHQQVTSPTGTGDRSTEPRRELNQVRLVPPETSEETQTGPQQSKVATQPSTLASAESTESSSLAAPFRIKLQDGRPKLQLSGLNDLRNSLAQVDVAALSAIQARENASESPNQETDSTSTQSEVAFQEALSATESTPAETPFETGITQQKPAFEETLPDRVGTKPEIEATPPEPDIVRSEALSEPPSAEVNASQSRPAFEETLPTNASPIEPALEKTPVEPNGARSEPALEPPPPDRADSQPEREVPNSATSFPESERTAGVAQSTPIQPKEATGAAQSAPVQAPTPATDPGWLSTVMENWATSLRNPQIWAILGFLLLLLIALVLLLIRRSAKSAEVEDLAFELAGREGQTTEESSKVGTDETIVESVPRKPKPFRPLRSSLERVDLLLAVGNYTEAERVVRQALSEDPSNTALLTKLLDVHYASGNAEEFLQEAEALHTTIEDDTDPLWEHVVQMGQELHPDHSLFGGKTVLDSKDTGTDAGKLTSGLHSDRDTREKSVETDGASGSLNFGAFTIPAETKKSSQSIGSGMADTLDGLDWQLPDIELPTATSKPSDDSMGTEEPQTQQLKGLDFEFEESLFDRKGQRIEEPKSDTEKDSFTLEKEDKGKAKERKSLDTLDELDWQLPDIEPPTATSGPSDDSMSAEEPQTQQLKGLDFEFEESTLDRKSQRFGELKSGAEKDSFTLEKEDQGKAKERKSLDTLDELDWQLPDIEPSTATPWSSRNKDLEEPETQLESLGFELHEFDKKPDLATESDEVSSTSEDYIETKLDLALAYLDMGDSVGARSLLEEVAQEGNSSQKQRAEECMAQLT